MVIMVFNSKNYRKWVKVVILVMIEDISIVILLVVICSCGIYITNSINCISICDQEVGVVNVVIAFVLVAVS